MFMTREIIEFILGGGRYYLRGARMFVVLYRPYLCVREGVSQCLGYVKAISVPSLSPF